MGHLRALELFCGIGGFSAAVAGSNIRVSAAVDHDRDALATYRHNFPGHQLLDCDIEKMSAWKLSAFDADIWWMSPPCQPYCERGARKDLEDHRAGSLKRITGILSSLSEKHLPKMIAMENVEGFKTSSARENLLSTLTGRGYEIHETLFCPTSLGIPSRRPRYYLAASLGNLVKHSPPCGTLTRHLPSYIDKDLCRIPPEELLLPEDMVEKYGNGIRVIDPSDSTSYTTCFTSGYGRSIMASGSYILCQDRVRRFSPLEIAALLHFPESFSFPDSITLRRKWHLIGNSLSIAAVREILGMFPEIIL